VNVEVAVVGGGLLGLATASALARRGREVVVLERFTVGHGWAGSKGTARVFRLGYDEPGYVTMAMRAGELWRDLEEASGRALLEETGQVTFGVDLEVLKASLSAAGAPWEPLRPGDLTERFPGLAVTGPALLEPRSGVLAADACLEALAATPGVDLREETGVGAIDDDGRRVTLSTPTGPVTAEQVVVCAGPWSASLLGGTVPSGPFRASLEQVAYLEPGPTTPVVMPVFIERAHPWVYGLPVAADRVYKVALHGGGPTVDSDRATDDPDPDLLATLTAASARILPTHDPIPVRTERCLYDLTPDEDFVLDRVGRVTLGFGTSGHGFKFGPLLGEVLADLVTGVEPSVDLAGFGLGRSALRGQ
jgi:sarcosine oxidase